MNKIPLQDDHFEEYMFPEMEFIYKAPEFFNHLKIISKREIDITMDYLLTTMSYREVGEKYKLSPERIRQIYNKTLRKIRYITRNWEIKPKNK